MNLSLFFKSKDSNCASVSKMYAMSATEKGKSFFLSLLNEKSPLSVTTEQHWAQGEVGSRSFQQLRQAQNQALSEFSLYALRKYHQ